MKEKEIRQLAKDSDLRLRGKDIKVVRQAAKDLEEMIREVSRCPMEKESHWMHRNRTDMREDLPGGDEEDH